MIYAENILICIAVPFLISLIFLRKQARMFAVTFLLGMGVCLLGAYIGGFIHLVSGMSENDTAVFLSPVIEELMKFMPLFFYLYLFRPDEDSLLLAGIGIGTGFALFENCCYILSSGAESLPYILIRGLAVGVMHIVSMVTLALCITLALRFRALTFSSVTGALSLSMTFHGLYNLLVSGSGITVWVGYILPVSVAFILYIPFNKLKNLEIL